MIIKEYRIVLPVSVEEYQVGQLYAVAEASKNETGGGEGVEVLDNKPYEENGEKGQYTRKIYHLESKVPGFVRVIAPKSSLKLQEEAWNAYPYCKTILTNEYMDKKFKITIETMHKPDMGEEENVHHKDEETYKKTEIVNIDIACNDPAVITPKDYRETEDPAKVKSQKTGRGPLGPHWKEELAANPSCPHMCAYKLVTVEFKMFGLQDKIENFIHTFEKRVFTKFHRQMFCWLDDWIDLTMEDIRRLEDDTKEELDKLRQTEKARGTSAE